MLITHKIQIDIQAPESPPRINVVCGDAYTRKLELTLFSGGAEWPVPDGVSAAVRYSRSDGHGGLYDTLPDGKAACDIDGNVVTAILAPQVLSAPGFAKVSVALIKEEMILGLFPVGINVKANPAMEVTKGESYYNYPSIGLINEAIGDLQELETSDKSNLVAAINEAARSGGNDSSQNGDYSGIEPAYDDIPKVFFGGALQQTKDEKVVPFRYISKTEDISGYAEIKAQGNSSMSFPKKNQTVKLFKDADCTEKLKVDFKGWGKQNKFCFKANWIDLTHARNIISARLWADVVKSRANYATLPEGLRESPNLGAIDGFPIKVYADGVYQGRYTINIPKDKWMANQNDNLETHCILCGENYASGCFRAAANIDGNDWTDEIHDTVPAAIKTRWNEVISFVMNSTDGEFKANLGNYFDIPSLLDYLLFGLANCGLDAFGKNQIYMTYDGQKWLASMYDMDSTWGLYFDGSKLVPTDYARTQYEDYRVSGRKGNLLYIRLEQLFGSNLKMRWAELKAGALSIENIINRFERFTDIAPAELVKEDYASTTGGGKFTGIPSKDTNNIQQIRAFALARQAWTDEYVAALNGESGGDDSGDSGEEDTTISCTGITLSASTLTFTEAGTQTLIATVTPDGCTDAVTWESSNTSVAAVSGGVVTTTGNGKATITAHCGNHSASCAVSVSGITEFILPMTTGYALNDTTGAVIANDNGFVSDYVDVQNYRNIFIDFEHAWVAVCAYDANKQYLKTVKAKKGDGVKTVFVTSADIVGVSYLRVSCELAGGTSARVICFPDSLELTLGKTLDSNGEIKDGSTSSANYALEEYVEVTPGKTYVVTATNVWIDVKGYDSDKTFVSALNSASGSVKTATITIPDGVSFVRWACTGTNTSLYTKIEEV